MIVKKNKSSKVVKKLTKFKPLVLSRHGSHNWLKENIGLLPFRSVVRLGSTTTLGHLYNHRPLINQDRVIECNTVQAVKTSSNKLLMKEAFNEANIKTAEWVHNANNIDGVNNWAREKYPIIAKHLYGSRGEGVYMIKDENELRSWLTGKTLNNYIFEKYYNYTKEYRIHVSAQGAFYTCRKMLRSDVPKDKRFIRNDSTCVWFLEDNAQFDKPSNWNTIVEECIKALKATGLDIGGFDVRVQSSHTSKGKVRENPDFIIVESNSACSHGDLTRERYLSEVLKVLKSKFELNNRL